MAGLVLCLVLVFVWGERAGAAGGDLDTSFNYGGAGANDVVFATAVQPDGKIIIGGQFTSYNGDANASDYIARLKTDGTLDTSFNSGGAGADVYVFAVALQPDGKVIIGGNFTSYNGNAAPDRVARLNTDGTLDTSFNNGGAGADTPVYAVAVQPDGKILIGGAFTSYNGDANASNYVARLNADGTLDTSFNNGGVGADGDVRAIAMQSDGKILIGGDFQSYNGDAVASNRIARLNSDGTLDTSFNYVTGNSLGADTPVYAVAVQPDGKILIGGEFSKYNEDVGASDGIARLNADGTLDTSFNNNFNGLGTDGFVYAVAVQSNGKILIGGQFSNYVGVGVSHDIARLNTDGTLDTSFNNGGAGLDGSGTVYAAAVQPDGKILIGGGFQSYNGDAAFSDRIARLLPSPGEISFSAASQSVSESAGNATITLTRTGGTDNQVVAKVTLADVTTTPADYRFTPGSADAAFNTGTGADNEVWSVAAQADGKILIGGKFLNYNGTARTRIARLNADGTLDASFNPGTGPNDADDTDDNVYAIAIQPDGRILIGGHFTDYDGTARSNIARLNSDGSLDATFNPGAGATGTVPDVRTIVLQPDGKAIIGGNFTMYDGTARGRIARLNSDGTLDTSFAAGAGATGGGVFAMALYSDGKVFIGGAFTMYDGTARGRVARINSDGTLDTSFAPSTGAEGSGINVWAVAIQPDGGVLIGGNFTVYNGTARGRIVRANADGTLDATFNPGTGANSVVWTTTIQPDGKIIVCGAFSAYNGTMRGRILRVNTNGSLDTSFNPGTGANAVILSATALQPDGRIAFGGQFTTFNGATSNRVARVNGDLFVTWPAGDATDKTINLPIVNDGVNGESDESLNLSLAVMSGGATPGSPNMSTLTIQDPNDAPLNTVPASQTTNEDTPRVFSAANGNLISIADADAGTNAVRVTLTATHGTVTLSGTTGLTFITGDGTNDAMMSFTGTVTNINAALNGLSFAPAANYGGAATLQIVTNDLGNTGTGGAQSDTDTVNLTVTPIADTPSVTNSTTAENAKTTTGLVISRNAADTATTTHFKITAITNGTLYQNNGTTVISNNQFITFAQGNAGLKFQPTAGLSSPATSFSFKVQASTSAADAGLGGSLATATITVNEGGVLKFSAATYSVGEATATMTVTATRTGGSGGATSVKYATSNGTATGFTSCAAGKDYVTKTGTLSWANNDMANKTFTIPICNDTVFEGNETINLALSNVTGSASLGTPQTAVLTIVDNETQPKLSVNSVMVTEGNAGTLNAVFTVNLSGASSQTVTVKYATVNGTATAPADYTAVPLTTLTFTPGQLSKTVSVAVKGDLIDELDETFKVMLSSPTNAIIAAGAGVGTIKDNDTATIAITNATMTEPDANTVNMTFTVSLSLASSRTVTVKYATANNTATAPADYTALALTTLTFTPGQTTKTVTVQIKGELLVEPNETFFVNLSAPVNATIADAQGLGTITNDD